VGGLWTRSYTAGGSRDYATPVYSALDAAQPFLQTSNGFAGTASDGLTQLDAGHALGTPQDTATNGNVTQTARVDLSGGAFTLALGFGVDQATAVGAVEATLSSPADSVRAAYESGWHDYDSGLIAPPASYAGVAATQWGQLVDEYYLNANVLKASEDKTYPGALVASLAVPWGQSVAADTTTVDFGYREVFARDLYEQWTGLYADGDLATARDIVTFLFDRQQKPDGSFPRNSLLNGQPAPDAFNTQLDECSYPTIMAFQLGMTDSALYQNHVKPAADFVVAHGPAYGVERWEEQSGYSPSSIAAEIAGLVAAADIADLNGDAASARTWRAVADSWQRSIKGWTVTTSGTAAGNTGGRYFIRLSKDGDPNAATTYNVGNGGPTLDQRDVIDAGFLELVRLGLLPAGDTDIVHSLPVVDAAIKTDTPSGTGYHRYNGDDYGDRSGNGQPWDDADNHQGTGHVWPVLSGERGEYDLAANDAADTLSLLDAMRRFAGGGGLIPEQDWDQSDLAASPYGTDPMVASIGFQDGQPAGSAAPLNWVAGQYVRLLRDLTANGLIEQPADVANRYITPSLSVAAPATLPAGGSGTVTTVYTNTTGSTVQNLAVDLHAPSGWTVQASSSATFASVPNGASERTTWNVTRPANAGIGADDLVATALYTVSGVPTRDQAETTVADGALAGGGTGAAGHGGAGSLGTVDLTSEGALDWAHWGLNDPTSFDHKSAGGSQISAAASINSTAVQQLADNPTGFIWSDGTPDGSASGTTTGIYVAGQGNGLRFTAPAGTTTRTLKVYVGLYKAQGRLQATLSDGSAPAFDDASLDDKTGTSNGVYTLTYRAASPGQTLTVTWSAAVSYDAPGNVTLESATLQQASPSDSPPPPPADTPELGSGELLATGLLPLGLALLVRRRRTRSATRR